MLKRSEFSALFKLSFNWEITTSHSESTGTKVYHKQRVVSYLSYRNRVVRIRRNLDLYPFHESLKLFPDVTCSFHGAVLYKVLKAPLGGVPSLHPLIIHIQQGQVISAGTKEVNARVVRVHDFILGAVENGVVYGQHGGDGENLFDAFVSDRYKKKIHQSALWTSHETDLLSPNTCLP